MKAAVRYFSRGGNVKAMAEAFARGAGVEAVSVDDPQAPLTEHVDILFVGGALYKYGLDKQLVEYLKAIPEGLVGLAVCFGSSFLTRRPVYLIQGLLKDRGIAIAPQAVYARNRPKQTLLDACEYFASTEVGKDDNPDGLTEAERVRAMKIAVGDVSLHDDQDDVEDDAYGSDASDVPAVEDEPANEGNAGDDASDV